MYVSVRVCVVCWQLREKGVLSTNIQVDKQAMGMVMDIIQ